MDQLKIKFWRSNRANKCICIHTIIEISLGIGVSLEAQNPTDNNILCNLKSHERNKKQKKKHMRLQMNKEHGNNNNNIGKVKQKHRNRIILCVLWVKSQGCQVQRWQSKREWDGWSLGTHTEMGVNSTLTREYFSWTSFSIISQPWHSYSVEFIIAEWWSSISLVRNQNHNYNL